MRTYHFSKFILLCVAIFFTNNIVAQDSYDIQLNGLRLYNQVSYGDLVSRFGVPDDSYLEDDGSLSEVAIVYVYGNNTLTVANGRLSGFSVVDNKWKICVDGLTESLQIGSSVPEFEGNSRFQLLTHPIYSETFYLVDNPLPNNPPDTYLMIESSEGSIVSLIYNEY